MGVEADLDLLSAALMFAAALVPAFLAVRLRGSTRVLTICLTSFILSHGVYHLVRLQGLETMADGVFEPLSVALLIAFGVIYLQVSSKKAKGMPDI